MKKFRKFVSLILALALVLPTFSMSYASNQPAYLVDIYQSANYEAISVCNYLGIVNGNPDGTYLPDKPVTRAEFAAMMTRALAVPESALQGFSSSKFKDTTGYSWAVPYLAFCESKGIMLGDGNGNAMPGKTITLNEAITMALRAVGYTSNSALLTGTWPANYISIAQNNDLYTDVAGDATVDRENAAQLIYNTLFVQMVSVDSDGDTTLLKDSSDDARTLLNTGLGCTMEEGLIDLGGYSDSLINLGMYIGSYGEIYLNDDDQVVAVKPTVTRLHGNVNPDATKFVLDDGTKLDLEDTEYTSPASAFIVNSEVQYTFNSCAAFAYMPLTIYADVKGDNIDKIYSAVFWVADDYFEVDSSIIDELAEDKTINGWNLPLTDDGEIDFTQFGFYGINSLADMKEGDNVYVYQNYNTDDEVNYIEIGTGKISGEVTEYDDSDPYVDWYTIGDQLVKSYKPPFPRLDVGASYDISLDAWGFIYDFDKTSGAADTYGVVKAATAESAFDNYKIKLYTSEASTKTLYLSEEDPADIDWTSASATTIGAVTPGGVGGGLIGYGLDSNGDIDSIDNTAAQFGSGATFKSSKVVGGMSIDPDCVVFTYDTAYITSSGVTLDVAALDDIDAGTVIANTTYAGFYILNDDGDVVAMLISSTFANADNDDVYGVFNTRKSTTTDGDPVYKFIGFIDGTAFTYKTTDDTNNEAGSTGSYGSLAGIFGVYAITTDTNSEITKIADLNHSCTTDVRSGYLYDTTSSVSAVGTVTVLGSDNTVFTINGAKFVADDDAVVYKFDDADDEYTVSKLSSIDEGDMVILYDTKGTDADGIATVVIYIAE